MVYSNIAPRDMLHELVTQCDNLCTVCQMLSEL